MRYHYLLTLSTFCLGWAAIDVVKGTIKTSTHGFTLAALALVVIYLAIKEARS
jgi:hypothetical protein